MSTNMFMNLGNLIQGEAEASGYENWCEIITVDHGFTQPATPVPESEQEDEDPKPKHDKVKVKKHIDNATTEILKAVWDGTVLPTVIIRCLRASGDNEPVGYLELELQDVIISEYELEFDEGAIPSEALELDYKEVKYTYKAIDKAIGKSRPGPSGRKFASHNRETNQVT